MAQYENMRLCGGTFMVLLLEAKGQRRNTRMGEGRSSDGKSNPEIFRNLILAVNPNFQIPAGRSFNTFTSDYKLCRSSDSPAVRLTDELLIEKFDNDIKAKFYECLGLFNGHLERVIDFEIKGPWLVAALIDLIEADETIPDDALFYVRPYGHAVSKADLRNIECICIPAFIFGVWHYIITHIKDNTVGADTIDHLLSRNIESRAERKFASDIGKKTVSEISTSIQPPECERKNYHDPAFEAAMDNIPLAVVSPGVAVDVRNIKDRRIYVDGKQVFYLDGKDHDALPVSHTSPFETYLEKATDYYCKVKTLLYSEAPHDFHTLYVPNDVTPKNLNTRSELYLKETRPIEEYVAKGLGNVILCGTGGIGKSMMMRYLLLHFAEQHHDIALLPILASLKNFTEQTTSLETFIFNAVHEFDRELEFDKFETALTTGKCLILLDGLDEIPGSARHKFDSALSSFMKAYRQNQIVISSRPTSNFVQFGHFLVFDVEPFSKEKALELIDKLEYHNPEAKAKFRDDLDKKLYLSHKQFASNPLLLTIMLMTYTSYGEVPAKCHIFYAKAYETMARLHDASKGAYVRPMHTELSPEDFSVYFAEFCARTYKAEILEFTEKTFTDCMTKVIRHVGGVTKASPRDFLLDLTENLCIMYREGDKYYFIHRSFQEYFSAVFFSNQMDDQLGRIGEFFDNQRHRQFGDRTFDMLYDMIPSRIDRYIFLPFLKQLWTKCDNEDGYWTFLDEMYPTVYAQEGNPGDCYENDPTSYLFNFIVNESLRRHNGELYNIRWPSAIDYCDRKEWVSIEKERYYQDGKCRSFTEIVELDDVDDEYIDEYGEPELEGVSWTIEISDLLRQREFFKELIFFMENDTFPLKKEYNEMREFTEQLDKSINEKPSSDDWFDSF